VPGAVKPPILLRSASVLTLGHALLNTFAGLLSGTSNNQEEVTLLNAMKALQFDAIGSPRTYWDFYFGLTVNLLLLSTLLWQLASLVKTEPKIAQPFIGSLCIAFLAFAVLSWRYFFIAPLVVEGLVALLLGLAYAFSRR
jgi:hypothetical protein